MSISVVCRGIAWFHSLPFLVTGPAAALAGKGVSGWADFDLRRRLTGHPFPSFAKSFHAEIRTICEFLNATGQSSRKYMPVEHVVKYLLILRLWCFDSEIKVDTQMATVSGRLLPTTIVEGWSRPQVLIPENSHAVFQSCTSAKNRYEAIHLECESTTPTHSQQWAHRTTRHWDHSSDPFIIYFFRKIHQFIKIHHQFHFSFFLKCKTFEPDFEFCGILVIIFQVSWGLWCFSQKLQELLGHLQCQSPNAARWTLLKNTVRWHWNTLNAWWDTFLIA